MMTQPKVSKIEYSDFSFEDFLQDFFFIESVKCSDEESRAFWKENQIPKNAGACFFTFGEKSPACDTYCLEVNLLENVP
jgi:hypothetical protein